MSNILEENKEDAQPLTLAIFPVIWMLVTLISIRQTAKQIYESHDYILWEIPKLYAEDPKPNNEISKPMPMCGPCSIHL